MKYDYDVIIIGSGPAGFSCAMQSSKFDKKVLVVEATKENFGGTWINVGTVPSKALRETARIIRRFQHQFGDEDKKAYEEYQMQDLLMYKNEILKSKNTKVENDLAKNEIDTLKGFGKLKNDHEVEISLHDGSTKTVSGEYILISTGATPDRPSNFDIDGEKILGYSSILSMTHIPRRLVIIGSGVNALEYATTFSSLGSRVAILNEKNDFLNFLDHEILEQLNGILDREKIEVTSNVKNIEISENTLRNTMEVKYQINNDNEQDRYYVNETEHVLYLGGYRPNTTKIGLENTNVQTDEMGNIIVDKAYRTDAPNIYAAGDVIGFPGLASASFSEGRVASCSMFGVEIQEVPPEIPFAIYSIPEIANIGLTERDARNMGLDVTVGRAYYKNITQGDISKQQDGLLKIVFATDTFKILGVHIIGERASDLVHLGQAVMSLNGDIRYFINHVMNYPTYSEAYRVAAFNGINRVYKAGVKYKKILRGKKDPEQDQT
ncbi:Si-specific NAD(P)(+) transhydrogenase [Balneola sp. MJW-20]|uniref:Si-specific NAD(P)(+) transhydrogenase n=1 Tax=Gracilimonas aurantiaca TaxID=3234185 RepID=UPI00346650EE